MPKHRSSKSAATIARLEEMGFDDCSKSSSGHVRIGCSQCQALAVNGVATHEHGCPNRTYECRGCSNRVRRAGSYCGDCS